MVSYGEMIERIAELMGVGRMPVGFGSSLTPVASATVSAVTGQPLELVRPLMESLESDVLPRDAGSDGAHLRHPPAAASSAPSSARSPSGRRHEPLGAR